MTGPIVAQHIQEFATAWYRALDVHAAIGECRRMLADAGLNMRFPDGNITDFLSFQKWYERVTNRFFDEKHTVETIDILNSTDDQAELRVVVRWQSSWWEPPAAQSERVDLESTQGWTVRRCSTTKNPFGLEIVSYIARAEDFKYAPGSAVLAPPAAGDADELVRFNELIAEMEQRGDSEAEQFFSTCLSQNLVFRRATGKVVGKFGDDGFIAGLKTNPFTSRVPEEISANVLGERALVTLVIVGTRKDDGSVHRYRNIRMFSKQGDDWILEFWYNYELTTL